MKTKFSIILTLLLAFTVHLSHAQEKTISGTVTDQDGMPLPGVNIVVKGTTSGTQTDFDGNYTIRANAGQTLLFTYIGQQDAERTIGTGNTINVQLAESAQALDEVIVTSQGIRREKKALGYAVTTVGSENLEQKAEGDLGRVLNGQASGVQINATNGMSGSGTNMIIRGYTSVTGGNQPLFIVDGIPFNSGTNAQGDFVDGNNGSSRFIDLDPNSIESISILKGLAASALYGTAGRNGVILITTKNGAAGAANKKFEITVNQSVFFNEIASFPDYTDKYGGGFDQAFGWFFSNWGPSFSSTNPNDFGSAFMGFDNDGTPLINNPTQNNSVLASHFPEYAGVPYRYQPYDGVKDFFRTGTVLNTSVNVGGQSEDGKMAYNANFGHMDDQGFTPGNSLKRNTFGLGGKIELSNNFSVNGTLNYSRTDFISPPVAASAGNGAFGESSSVFGHLFFTPRSIDLMNLPYQSPVDGRSVYYRGGNDIQNPRWTAANAFGNQYTNRVYGNGTVSYKINDNINFFWRTTIDFFTERNESGQNKGGAEGPLLGRYTTYDNKNTTWDHTFQLNGNYLITEDLDISFNVGANARRTEFSRQGVQSDQQKVFNIFRHYNFESQTPIQFDSDQNIVGMYGQAEFGYKNYAYLTLVGRNDWVSNFASENRSIFYPSASVSFIPTTAFEGWSNFEGLNFLKIRAGYGTSAGFAGDYPIFSGLDLNTREFIIDGTLVTSNTVANGLGNTSLKPERVSEIELGIESRFIQNRVSLDLSVYQKTTTDLITSRPLDPATGYTSTFTNIGEVQVKGIEADLSYAVFRNEGEGFNWTISGNFTTDETTVKDLGNDTDNIRITQDSNITLGTSDLGNFAVEGRPYGIIMGNRVLRDENGNLMVDSGGMYIAEAGLFEIGDPNPDWRLNINNNFRYKNFSLGMSWAYRHGGDIYTNTVSALVGRGLVTDTEDREDTFILPGVKEDGTTNNIQVNNSDFYFSNIAFGPSELQIYDGSILRLREVSFGYSLPQRMLEKTPFGTVNITFSGQNLWYKAFGVPSSTNFDTDAVGTGVGNGFGLEFLNGPSSRRYGMSIKVTF
ncbi:SusC/RagA family TonB-linked outer membrane protein [Sinomicrobium sp. M5D2P9]